LNSLATKKFLMRKKEVPSFDELMAPTVQALRNLGGSASIDELVPEIVRVMALPQEVADVPHGSSGRTELEYRSAWARTYLRRAGLLENSERGVWSLTPEGTNAPALDGRKIARDVAKQFQQERAAGTDSAVAPETDEADTATSWKDKLVAVLQLMDPIAFERLCQRILRESGFIEVEVTRRSGDGGIDGHGVIRIGGLISFNVLFQSKRYKGNIGPDTVRDFRGAMVGRADKGLLISTGGFTLEARKEATRDGAPPIDLIDGRLLADKLKELKLGVKTNLVENVEVVEDWFRTI
jgi:restriction system protein